MAKPLGTCTNCLRDGMKIGSASGHSLCGSCQAAIAGTVPGTERELRLQEAAEKFAGKPKMTVGKKAKPKVEVIRSEEQPSPPPAVAGYVEENRQISSPSGAIVQAVQLPAPPKVEENHQTGGTGVPPVMPEAEKTFHRGVFINFAMPEDAELITRIEDIAKKERRTMSAQILYFLDKEMKFQEQKCR